MKARVRAAWLLVTLRSFAMWPPFPASDYCEGSRSIPARSADDWPQPGCRSDSLANCWMCRQFRLSRPSRIHEAR